MSKVASQCKESSVACNVDTPMEGEILQNDLHTGESHINALHTGESHINALHIGESHNVLPTGGSHINDLPTVDCHINAIPTAHMNCDSSKVFRHKSAKLPKRPRRPGRTADLREAKVAKKCQKDADKKNYELLTSKPMPSHPEEVMSQISAALSAATS